MYTCESNILLGWSFFLFCLELNMKEDVAGATFMAVGSSAPEFCTTLIGMSLILYHLTWSQMLVYRDKYIHIATAMRP